MPSPLEQPPAAEPPRWAVERAEEELVDLSDRTAIIRRAWEIVRETAVLEDERHNEYDDPDEGGEG